MNKCWQILLFLSFFSGKSDDLAFTSQALLLPNSYIKILGSTNINSFYCIYFEDSSPDTFLISTLQDNGKYYFNANIHIPVKTFDCGNKIMNNDFQELLKEKYFPKIAIRFNSNDIFSFITHDNQPEEQFIVPVTLMIANKENVYNFNLRISVADNYAFSLSGKKMINIKDFGLTPPEKVLGIIKVDEKIEVAFWLKFTLFDLAALKHSLN